MNQELFEKHLCDQSRHYEKYSEFLLCKGNPHVLPTILKAFWVDLKVFLYLVLPNQYCSIIIWENLDWFLGDQDTR